MSVSVCRLGTERARHNRLFGAWKAILTLVPIPPKLRALSVAVNAWDGSKAVTDMCAKNCWADPGHGMILSVSCG